MRTVMPPAEYGTPNWLATTTEVGTGETVVFGLFGRPYMKERLYWGDGEYDVTEIKPYEPASL